MLSPIEFVNRLDGGMYNQHYEMSLQGFMTINPAFALMVMSLVHQEKGITFLPYSGIITLYNFLDKKEA